MLHKAFGTPKKQKNNKKLKKHFLGKIFNFDLKKQLQLVKDLEVIHSKNQTKQTQINFIFEKAKNVKRTTTTNLLSCQTHYSNP